MLRFLSLVCAVVLVVGCEPAASPSGDDAASDGAVTLRVMTYNIEDVRTADINDPEHPRLKKAAAIIQRLRPDILLINEMAYDVAGGPDVREGMPAGMNGQRFANNFLSVAQGPGLDALYYEAVTPPTNTGIASGFDLDNDGRVVATYPPVPPPLPDGSPSPQSAEGQAYGNDAFGFGTFPGQYGMTLLVRDGLDVDREAIRSFRMLKWNAMPDPRLPVDSTTGTVWYSPEELDAFRLSSKTHIDVPVELPNETVLHVLASHPTPPAFDGPARRNVRRNYAEIRFWADYLDNAPYIEDDSTIRGGLPKDVPFVLLGDLNADPDEGDATGPITQFLLTHPRIDGTFVPVADSLARAAYPDLDPDDTARWGLRVDYVLPSENLIIRDGGVYRPVGSDTVGVEVSDHFPVWLDVAVPKRE